ncbi:MAG: hypothetical protein J7K26_02940, partial [Candidatus Aenigmarchaeota archaeon]|nr:hypothetical protein [Candidatus Aenigmarchaeota archaeon]
YNPDEDFIKNCRKSFKPSEEMTIYLPDGIEDEITRKAIEIYESSEEYKQILQKLIKLYEKAIKKVKQQS